MTIMTSIARLVALPVLVATIGACESLTETEQRQPLSATLSGDSVKPTAVSTGGTGTFSATLTNRNGKVALEYSLSFSGLAGNGNSATLKGPADASSTASTLVDLAGGLALPPGSTGTSNLGGPSGSAQGTLDLTTPLIFAGISGDSLHKLLDAGLVYVQVHSSAHPTGELRGQIRKR